MKIISSEALYYKGLPKQVASELTLVFYKELAVYIPKGTRYHANSSEIDVGGKKTTGLSHTNIRSLYETFIAPSGERRTRVRQGVNELVSYPVTEVSIEGISLNNIGLWTPSMLCALVKSDSDTVSLLRDLGLSFVEAELLVPDSPLRKAYPKTIAALEQPSIAPRGSRPKNVASAMSIIQHWLHHVDEASTRELIESSWITCEEPIDLEGVWQTINAERMINECLWPLVGACPAFWLLSRVSYWYSYADHRKLRVLLCSGGGGCPYPQVGQQVAISKARSRPLLMARDQFLYAEDARYAKEQLEGPFHKGYVTEYVVKGIAGHTRAVLSFAEHRHVLHAGVLPELRRRYLWHYAEPVARACVVFAQSDDCEWYNRKDLTELVLTFPLRDLPASPYAFLPPPDDKKERWDDEDWDELFDDVPGLRLPAIPGTDTIAARPERIIGWQLWFDRYQYEGTPFEQLARPWDTTREHYALMLSSLPDGPSAIHHLRVPCGSMESMVECTPATAVEWNDWLDHFYEHLAEYRTLDSVPMRDRTLKVCERYLLAGQHDLRLDATMVPTEVFWALAAKYPLDARFVDLRLVVTGDERFVDCLRSVPGYFTTVLERMTDPMLIVKLAYMAITPVGNGSGAIYDSGAVNGSVVTLDQVPEVFRTSGICDAYYRASSANLAFIPPRLRQGHWEL